MIPESGDSRKPKRKESADGKREGCVENLSLSLERFMVYGLCGLSHMDGKGRNRIWHAETEGPGS